LNRLRREAGIAPGGEVRLILGADDSGVCLVLDKAMNMEAIEQAIGANGLDVVRLVDGLHVMLVDDVGLYKEVGLNTIATALYHERCHEGVTQGIVGAVAIMPDSDYA
jgi:hypothetical protein